ncbi:alpha/beta hydrolase [Erythrobacter sp. T5W1-R]|uniref:alpha/beta hydrolase n=1 Tax=Erythrobacter sp. T5W1-R TaxID=3101752 RepID=UPI002AFFA21C|nr:alpha/beta hydrolase [Erythrobacter sp. T5W1-R]MEA1617530.1 alpha/beta hydrolase [Erythrobacter sp. T5W1-R]
MTESHWYARDGHALRRIDWPGVPDASGALRGAILFFPGRGDFYEKYLETLEQWHQDGWRVTAADWRGQAGSGRLGKDPVTGHIADFAMWIADLAAFWADWVSTTPGPHVLAGHSMGGHLVLRGVMEGRVAPDALVLSAPMVGVKGPALPLALLHGVARLMCALGEPTRPAWKWSEKPGELPAGRADLLTHDAARYGDEEFWRETRPELVMGPASWRWVERAYASWPQLEAPGALEAVTIPVLILSTSADALVSHPANLRAAQRLPKGELVAFGPEARHEILREVDPVRDRAMAAIREFLDRCAPHANPPA